LVRETPLGERVEGRAGTRIAASAFNRSSVMPKLVRSLPLASAPASALSVGALLGALLWALARVPDQQAFHLATGLILLGAGSTSFVLFRLHSQSRRARATRASIASETRSSLTWLSCGVLFALNALPLVLG
jgi:hypothetical protein